MAQWAIFYNAQDYASIAGSFNASVLSAADKNEAMRYWNGGLKDWANAPAGVSPCDDPFIPENAGIVRCVINVNNRTPEDFKALLRRLAETYPSLEWLRGLANDLDGCSGLWSPWPPV